MKVFSISAMMVLLAASGACWAEENAVVTSPCIRMSDVDHTSVIDRKTILVTMKRNEYRRIDLATRCVGLAVEETFAFNMQTYELCKATPLRVVNGGTCMIETITAIDKAAAKALLKKK